MRKKLAHPNEIQNTSNHIYIFIRSISLVVLILFTVKSLIMMRTDMQSKHFVKSSFCQRIRDDFEIELDFAL